MKTKDYERIQYLTAKAQRGSITPEERRELAVLIGRDPKKFEEDKDLDTLIGLALLVIAIAIIAGLFSKN